MSANGGCENEVVYKLNEGAKVLGVVNRVVSSINVSLGAKSLRCMIGVSRMDRVRNDSV